MKNTCFWKFLVLIVAVTIADHVHAGVYDRNANSLKVFVEGVDFEIYNSSSCSMAIVLDEQKFTCKDEVDTNALGDVVGFKADHGKVIVSMNGVFSEPLDCFLKCYFLLNEFEGYKYEGVNVMAAFDYKK
jgi:hypothetical protein